MPAGTYHVLIHLTDTNGQVATLDSGQMLTMQAAVVDLAGKFTLVPAKTTDGTNTTFTFTITNLEDANVPAIGLLPFKLYSSTDGQLNDAALLLNSSHRINLKKGQSTKISIHAQLFSTTTLIVELDPTDSAFPDELTNADKQFDSPAAIQVVTAKK